MSDAANVIFWRCRHQILSRAAGIYSMPGEVIGSEIAEALLRAAYQQMLATALAQRGLRAAGDAVKPGDIRLVSPLVPG